MLFHGVPRDTLESRVFWWYFWWYRFDTPNTPPAAFAGVSMLTEIQIRKVRPPKEGESSPKKLVDQHGLQLHVFPTGRKTWIYDYRFNGKRKSYTIGSYDLFSLVDARAQHAQLRLKVEQGVDPGEDKKARKQKEKQEMPLIDLIDDYIKKEAIKHKGARWEIVRLEKIKRDFSDICRKPSDQVNQLDMINFRDARKKQVSGPSVSREMQLLGSVFRYGIRELRILKDSPLKDVDKPQTNPHRERRISDVEIDMVIASHGYERDTRPLLKKHQAAWAFLFAIETAMREGEICGMLKPNISEDYVLLPDTKNGTARKVPLSTYAKYLLSLVDNLDEVRVITIDPDSLSTTFRKHCKLTGLTDLRFHDARHEACTRLAKKLDLHDLAKVTGHKDLRMLMRYYNPTASELAEKINRKD